MTIVVEYEKARGQKEKDGLDRRPLREQLAARDAAAAAQALAGGALQQRLHDGATLVQIAGEVLDGSLDPGARAAWLAAITEVAAPG